MKQWLRCERCVLSKNYPQISFDENGICNYCATSSQTEHLRIVEDAKVQIEKLIHSVQGKQTHDVIVCYSGGKDSTFVLHYLSQILKLKCLAFTLDNGFIVDDAFKNIRNVTSRLGVDSIVYRPSASFMKKLYKYSELFYTAQELKRASAICSSCINLVNTVSIQLALEKKIPLIAGGFRSGQLPSKTLVYKPLTALFNQLRETKIKKISEHLGEETRNYFTISNAHAMPDLSCFNPLPTLQITEEEIYSVISQYGWTIPTGVDACSTNCAMNSYANIKHYEKHGFHPYEFELAKEVRDGLMTREEALKKIDIGATEDLNRAQKIQLSLETT